MGLRMVDPPLVRTVAAAAGRVKRRLRRTRGPPCGPLPYSMTMPLARIGPSYFLISLSTNFAA
jgi:hypothetical protein